METDAPTYEISGNEFIAAQTRQIEREFKTSRPKPRNKAMGFKGDPKTRRKHNRHFRYDDF